MVHSTSEEEFGRGASEDPGVLVRELRPIAENAAARYLIGFDAETGDRLVVVVARPLADLARDASEAHAATRLRRAAAAGELGLDGIAPLHAVGRTPGGHPFVISSLDGGSLLSETIAEFGTVGTAWSLAIIAEAAAVLARAHGDGVAHGTVSEHAIITGGRRAPVMLHGFGISAPCRSGARAGSRRPPDAAPMADRTSPPRDSRRKRLAPEQQGDVQALAAVLRRLVEPVGERGRHASEGLSALIERAEGGDPELSAQEFSTSLGELARDVEEPVPAATDEPAIELEPRPTRYDETHGRRYALLALVLALSFVLLLLLRPWLDADARAPREAAPAAESPPASNAERVP